MTTSESPETPIDALDIDLTPRDEPPVDAGRRTWRNRAILAVFALALGALLFQALTSAKVFAYNVEEALENKEDLGDRTFRMGGTVVSEPTSQQSGAMIFTLAFGDGRADVRHVGAEPTDLFGLGENVFVEGHWNGEVFQSEQILVKHDESYVEQDADVIYDSDQPPAPAAAE